MIQRPAIITALALVALFLPSTAEGSGCTSNSPARAVPQYDDNLAPGQSLWPLDGQGQIKLRPANVDLGADRSQVVALPKAQDSTQFMTLTIPGQNSGHELFQDVSVPGSREQTASQSDWLVTAYNAGIQVWNLKNDPERPYVEVQKDGWNGDWAHFAAPGEDDFYVFAVDSLRDGNTVYVAVSGVAAAGFTLWKFSTTAPGSTLKQVYQDLNVSSRDTALVKDPNGRVYAFVADVGGASGNNGGIRTYDVTTAALNTTVCVDPTGMDVCGVFEGNVGTIPRSQFVSAFVANGETYIAASDGNSGIFPKDRLQLWQVTDPEVPTAAALRFKGMSSWVHTPQLFTYDGRQYLALVERTDTPTREEFMRIYDVSSCVDGTTCTGIGSLKATETIERLPANYHHLDISFSNGSPYLYYGVDGSGVTGSGFERLWEIGQLPSSTAKDQLPEITDGGATYIDPCNGSTVNYFGDYFEGNSHGLRNFTPRHAVFNGPYLYRAAVGVMDIHVRGGVAQTNDPEIVPRLQGPGSIDVNSFWMDDEVMLEAQPNQACLANATDWCWNAAADNPEVDVQTPTDPPNGCHASFDDPQKLIFACNPAGIRCADTSVTVAAWNTQCTGTEVDQNSVAFNLKDPTIDLASLNVGSSYPICSTVPLDASVNGRGGAQWSWTVDGEPIPGCSGTLANGVDLGTASFACSWDTTGLKFEEIFLDGFETGCGRWGGGCPAESMQLGYGTNKQLLARRGSLAVKSGGAVNVEFEIKNGSGVPIDSEFQWIDFFSDGDPTFTGALPAPEVVGSGATLRAPATGATLWVWEVEDPVAGTAPCSFNLGKSCVTQPTPEDSLDHLWISAGTYTYKVTISNCVSGAAPPTRTGSVTVDDLEPAQVIGFEVSRSMLQSTGDGTCYKDAIGGQCGIPQAVYCPKGVPIKFDLEVATEGAFTFSIDWARADANETPNFQAATPDSVNGTVYSFTHSFASGTPSPNFPVTEVPFAEPFALDHPLFHSGTCVP